MAKITLGQLNLSIPALNYVNRAYGTDIQRIIFEGRVIAYDNDYDLDAIKQKFQRELVTALDHRGYIRHDITRASFQMNCLIRTITEDLSIPTCIWEFGLNDGKAYDYVKANRTYESFSGGSLAPFKAYISKYLTEEEYDILIASYGLGGQKSMTYSEIAEETGCKFEHVRTIIASALRKLERCPAVQLGLLSVFTKTESEQEEFVMSIINEKEHFELIIVLLSTFTSTKVAEIAKDYLDKEAEDLFLEDLNLSSRTYNALKRNGINMLSQIINYPKEDWSSLRNIGKHSLEEIAAAVKEATGNDLF